MKNKKGFTLIELLAIIAVITTPIILNIIENSKKGAAQDSALGYKDAIQKYYASKLLEDHSFKIQGDYDISNLGELTNDLEEYQIAFSGTTPSGGYATIENGNLVSGCVQINEYAVRFEDGKISETKKESCTATPVIVEQYPQVQDANPGVICGSGNAEDYDNSSICYIYSVEDLVAFSYMVNDGKTFENKTVMLMNNLDITNDKSYVNKDATNFGDINGDNTTATIKAELTDENGKGLPAAGNDTNTFMGTFEGNAKILNNISIKTTNDYKGLIGYNSGTIRGLILNNMYVKGNIHVGLITGYNTGNIIDVQVNGDIDGRRNEGLIAGRTTGGTIKAIARGNINSTENKDSSYPNTGGIVGYVSGSAVINGIYQGGTIKCKKSMYCEKAYGYKDNNNSTTSIITAASATVRGTASTHTDIASKTGYTVSDYGIKNIAIYEKYFDTFIGGDNNEDGYYYDYDENGDVELYSRTDKPLIRTMQGNGTSETPYIINNYKQFKQAAYNPNAYYILNTDIDFTGKNPIMLSSEANPFTGNFNGQNHTLSNISIEGHNRTGLFGENSGTIIGLHLNNMNIKGERSAGMIGYNNDTGTAKGIWADGNITGSYFVGGIVGYNFGTVTEVQMIGNVYSRQQSGLLVGRMNGGTLKGIAKGNVDSSENYDSTYGYTGGIAGLVTGSNTIVQGVYQGGTITCKKSMYCEKAYGNKENSNATTSIITAASATVRGSATTNTDIASKTGYTVSDAGIKNIAVYEKHLDTFIGGDNDKDGYYYDYNENGDVELYTTQEKPFTITMSGAGTEASPYIINNYTQFREASYNPGAYYTLNTDINFTNQNPIMLSSEANPFTGNFDGGNHTLSNITIEGHSRTGLFGENQGTIHGLHLVNTNIKGENSVGAIGYNSGTIYGMWIEGNATGRYYVSLLTGRNYGTATNIQVNGNVHALQQAGLLAGRVDAGTIKGIAKGNVTATDNRDSTYSYAGSIAGVITGSGTNVRAVYQGGAIECGKSGYCSKAYGTKENNKATTVIYTSESATVRGNATTSDNCEGATGCTQTDSILQTTEPPYTSAGFTFDNTQPYYCAIESNGVNLKSN